MGKRAQCVGKLNPAFSFTFMISTQFSIAINTETIQRFVVDAPSEEAPPRLQASGEPVPKSHRTITYSRIGTTILLVARSSSLTLLQTLLYSRIFKPWKHMVISVAKFKHSLDIWRT
jgi:hypothetical protein